MKKIKYLTLALFLTLLTGCNTSNVLKEEPLLKQNENNTCLEASETEISKALEKARENYLSLSEDFSVSRYISDTSLCDYKAFTETTYSKSTNEFAFQESNSIEVDNFYAVLKDNKTKIYNNGQDGFIEGTYNSQSFRYLALKKSLFYNDQFSIINLPKSKNYFKEMYGFNFYEEIISSEKDDYEYTKCDDLYMVKEFYNCITTDGYNYEALIDLKVKNNKYDEFNLQIDVTNQELRKETLLIFYKFNYEVNNELLKVRNLTNKVLEEQVIDETTLEVRILNASSNLTFNVVDSKIQIPETLKNSNLTYKFYYDANKEYEIDITKPLPNYLTTHSRIYLDVKSKDNKPIVIEHIFVNNQQSDLSFKMYENDSVYNFDTIKKYDDNYRLVYCIADGELSYEIPQPIALKNGETHYIEYHLDKYNY